MRIGDDLLISLGVLGYLSQTRAGKIQTIEKCGIIKGTGGQCLAGVEQIEHAIGCRARLLNGGKPLANHSFTTRRAISCLQHIASRVDIGRGCAHGLVHHDAAFTGNAAAFDKVNVRLDPDSNQHDLAGDTRATCGDNAAHPAVFARNFSNLILNTHINTSAPFLLKNQV